MKKIILTTMTICALLVSSLSLAMTCQHSKIKLTNNSSTELEIIQHTYLSTMEVQGGRNGSKIPANGGSITLELSNPGSASGNLRGQIQLGHGSYYLSALIKYHFLNSDTCLISGEDATSLTVFEESLRGTLGKNPGKPAELLVNIFKK